MESLGVRVSDLRPSVMRMDLGKAAVIASMDRPLTALGVSGESREMIVHEK